MRGFLVTVALLMAPAYAAETDPVPAPPEAFVQDIVCDGCVALVKLDRLIKPTDQTAFLQNGLDLICIAALSLWQKCPAYVQSQADQLARLVTAGAQPYQACANVKLCPAPNDARR
ncbi:unnamed protein product, partial [Mesorhabditis spiculigera]